ncbi:hypothetical protein D3C75_1109970 [compost metagenome]
MQARRLQLFGQPRPGQRLGQRLAERLEQTPALRGEALALPRTYTKQRQRLFFH